MIEFALFLANNYTRMIKKISILLPLFVVKSFAFAQNLKATIKLDAEIKTGEIDNMIYGNFPCHAVIAFPTINE